MVASAGGQGSLIGSTLGGYEVVALIGRGAMGAVYLARDLKLGRQVALKVLLGSLARNPDSVRQFHSEAQAAAPLNHPGIVRIYSAGIESGTPYIAMEFVDGEPLDRFLSRKGRIDWDVALHIGGKIAQALDAAHRKGVVHSDIKPANIMLDKSGGMRLADFGIARIQSKEGPASSGGGFLGTPQYMSPEQATNKNVGPSSDLYSLGVVLYEMITGSLPFHGESSMALIKSICTDEATRIHKLVPEVPDDVSRFVAYLLEKNPKSRPANAKVAVEMISRLLRQQGEVSSFQSSLSVFLKEEMEIRPFSKVYDETNYLANRKQKDSKKPKNISFEIPWKRIRQLGLVSVLFLIGFFFSALKNTESSVDLSTSLSILEGSEQRKISNGLQLYSLDIDGYFISGLRWNENNSELFLEATGMDSRAIGENKGLLMLNLQSGDWKNVMSPRVLKETEPRIQPILQSILNLPSNEFYHQSIPAISRIPTKKKVVGISIPKGKTYPAPEILWSVPSSRWHESTTTEGISIEPSTSILSPDGRNMALLLFDESGDFGYIAELTLDGGNHKPIVKTTVGNPILASSIRYSANGAYISYIRKRATGDGELWLVRSGEEESNGRIIARGIQDAGYSFNSSVTKVVVQKKRANDTVSEIEIITVRNARTEKKLGFGEVGTRCWLNQNKGLVINQLQDDRTYQWTKVDLEKNYELTKLTQVSNGMSGEYSLSTDGSYLAGAIRSPEIPTVLVMKMSGVQL
jgi:serine/threonine protein kinase